MSRLLTVLLGILWLVGAPTIEAQPTRLTVSETDDRHPVFSPDGSKLVFESDRDGNWDLYTLLVGRGEVGEAVRLTDHAAADRFPAWAPSGEWLVFQSDRDGAPSLWVLSLAGGQAIPLGVGGGAEMSPDWSPRGNAIAYTRVRGERIDLELLRFDREPSRRLTRHRRRDVWPRFDPTGRRLAFFSRRDTGGEDDELYVLDLDGGAPRRVTTKEGHDFCPSWSPDGRFLAAASRDAGGERAIVIFDLEGVPRHGFAVGFTRATHPSWSPDGRRIAFAGREAGRYDLYVVEVPAELRPAAPQPTACCGAEHPAMWLQACTWIVNETSERPGDATYGSDVYFHREQDLAATLAAACDARLAALAPSDELRWPFTTALATAGCCRRHERMAWLQSCVEEARAIRPGHTRAELEERFRHDGGIFVPGDERYLHRDCIHVKLKLELQRADGADTFELNDEDVVLSIFGPYIGPLNVD